MFEVEGGGAGEGGGGMDGGGGMGGGFIRLGGLSWKANQFILFSPFLIIINNTHRVL